MLLTKTQLSRPGKAGADFSATQVYLGGCEVPLEQLVVLYSCLSFTVSFLHVVPSNLWVYSKAS